MTHLSKETREWLATTGFTVRDEAMWRAALTHGSTGDAANYERLEWLGDRVLGLSVSEWLFQTDDAPALQAQTGLVMQLQLVTA